MIINPNATLFNTIVFYVLIVVALAILKPEFMYDYKNNKFKNFGYGENKSIFALPVMGIICAIVIYFIFSSIETINNITQG